MGGSGLRKDIGKVFACSVRMLYIQNVRRTRLCEIMVLYEKVNTKPEIETDYSL